VLGASFAALALGAVVSLTVATGGAALAAAAAVAGVVFAISVADASCAYMNHRNACAPAGTSPPHNLPMGSSSIGNLVHWALTAAGVSPEWAKINASIADGVVRLSLGAAAAVCTLGAAPVLNSFEHITPMVVAAGTILQVGVDLVHNRSTAKVYAESMDQIEGAAEKIDKVMGKVDVAPEDKATMEKARNDVTLAAQQTKQLVSTLSRTAGNSVPLVAAASVVLGLSLVPLDLSVIGGPQDVGAPVFAKHAGGNSAGLSPQVARPVSDESAALLSTEQRG